MKTAPVEMNLLIAWLWLSLGFVSGMVLGLFFHRENWLGGYASFKRRLYRLAHISFFGLGAINLFFYLTARNLSSNPLLTSASWAFIAGAISMPACCLLMAHQPKSRMLFAVPVLSLIAGGVLTLATLISPTTLKEYSVCLRSCGSRQTQTAIRWSGPPPPPGPWTLNSI